MPDHKPGEAIIEFMQVGNSVRVTAIDAATGTEVTFQAPANQPPSSLKRIAIQKLNYVLRKQQQK